jgi:hypothetical protein
LLFSDEFFNGGQELQWLNYEILLADLPQVFFEATVGHINQKIPMKRIDSSNVKLSTIFLYHFSPSKSNIYDLLLDLRN